MRLTVLTDYSLRVLMYVGALPRRLVTIQEIVQGYGISENHLMKVVHGLAQHGFIETVRGRGGGFRLARPATEITVGAVIRAVEDDFALVECFWTDNTCRITPVCRLGALPAGARRVFRSSRQLDIGRTRRKAEGSPE